jgi:copper chaperone CopZ
MSNITTTFTLTGLHCESCKKISEKRVKKISGVTEVITNLETSELTISGDRAITKQEVVNALEGTDYQVN